MYALLLLTQLAGLVLPSCHPHCRWQPLKAWNAEGAATATSWRLGHCACSWLQGCHDVLQLTTSQSMDDAEVPMLGAQRASTTSGHDSPPQSPKKHVKPLSLLPLITLAFFEVRVVVCSALLGAAHQHQPMLGG